jgi:c-di-AMP phosphodiesterase-like protein
MANNEKSFFEQLKKAVAILIISAIIYFWYLWCKEKPIRFLYTFIVLVILYFIAESQQYHYQILSN